MSIAVEIEGYVLEKRMRSGGTNQVYQATRESDGSPVIVKLFSAGPTGASAARLEYEALRLAAGPGVPRGLGLDLAQEFPLLVMERLPGVSLSAWVKDALPSIPAFLTVAARITELLARAHGARVIHRDVTPRNVLVNPRTLETYLIDFGLAMPLGSSWRSEVRGANTGEIAGTLSYIAPEQTGRMNRSCDFRSDLYTLGATFYHALVGRPPFTAEDPLELIHAHIARRPTPLSEIRAEIPEVVSRLVLRLLNKDPIDRYQTARALQADLEALSEQLRLGHRLDEGFELGTADALTQLRFSGRLHGRRPEITRLREAFERARGGTAQSVLLCGTAGSGKSALVDALRSELGDEAGYLIAGRFEAERDRPYSGWIQALESSVQQLLVEGHESTDAWGTRLRHGLGNIARCLVDLVPDLAFIVGKTPPVPVLGPKETQARLSLALRRFIRVCAQEERPLILFLDDLHSSDAGSRLILEQLLLELRSVRLLVVGACPPLGSPEAAPLAKMLERVRERGVSPEPIEIAPLSIEASSQFLAEVLHLDSEAARPLAQLVELKTGNYPLLIRQFVEHLHAVGLLHYERSVGFVWDPEEVAAIDVPDGAVGLMSARIDRLDPRARKLIELASFLWDGFDSGLLCAISSLERAEVNAGLDTLSELGLIIASPGGFRFAHGRIRELAQSRLLPETRAHLHVEAGRLMLARTPKDRLGERAFEIADHLNQGLPHVPEDLVERLFELNVLAGRQALGSGAADTASGYLAAARCLLGQLGPESRQKVGFELHLSSSECAFQLGKFEESLALLEPLEQLDPSRIERVQIASKRIQVMSFTQTPETCVRYVLDVLRQLDVRWPVHPSLLRVELVTRILRWRLRRRTSDTVFRRAESIDPRWLAPLLLLAPSGRAMLRTDVRLSMLSSALAVRRYLRFGYAARPGFTLATHAYVAYTLLRDGTYARHCIQMANDLCERVPDPIYNPRARVVIHALLLPLLERRRKAVAPLEQVAEQALEIGDPESASYSRFLGQFFRTLAGDPVPECAARLEKLAESVAESGHSYPEVTAVHRVYTVLLEDEPDLAAAVEQSDRALASTGELPYVRTLWLMILCIHGRFDLALAQSDALGENLFRISPFVHVADHLFYRGLACAALAHAATGKTARRHRRELRRCLKRLRHWARNGEDFVHMVSLLEGERARLRGDVDRARSLFERSARRARQQEFPHHQALAFERLASMWASNRRETDAATALGRALHIYRIWDAPSKIHALLHPTGAR